MARPGPSPLPTKGQVRETYERIADSLAERRREPWPQVAGFVEGLPAHQRVLDLGCGNGRHVMALADRGHRVFAVDFSRRLLVAGRSARGDDGGRIHWIEADATALPIRSGRMGACLAIAVLHHLPSREERVAALREVRRVLVPGGAVFLSAWALDQPRFRDVLRNRASEPAETRGDVEVPWKLPDGTSVPRYYHLFQEGDLEGLIIESGLRGETFFRGSGNCFGLARRDG